MAEWRAYLDKALENLRACEALCNQGSFNATANRAYYAGYLAELAALQRFDLLKLPDTGGWRHKAVINTFAARLVKGRRLFDLSMHERISALEASRIKADYTPRHVTGQEARRCVTLAQEMVETIQQKIDAS